MIAFRAEILQQEAAGTVSVLRLAGMHAHLAHERRLLVARNAGDDELLQTERGADFSVDFAGTADFGQQARGNAEQLQHFFIPFSRMNVVEQCARGVARVGHVHRIAAGHFPKQPRVDGAKEQFAGFGAFANAGHVVEDPRDFRRGEISVEQQAGAFSNFLFMTGGAKVVAGFRGAAVLPDDGVVNGLASLAIPNDGGFPLIRDAERRNVARFDASAAESFHRNADLGGPDFLRVLLDPAPVADKSGGCPFAPRTGRGASRSKTMARTLVVPASRDRMYRMAGFELSLNQGLTQV